MTSPLALDPNARLAAERARTAEGDLLAVYASIRSSVRVPDPLVGLGLPVIAYVLGTVAVAPERVTAVHGRHTAGNPLWGLGTDVDLWSVLIRCSSGMTITLDVGAGPWTAGAAPVELRVEWMTPNQVTVFQPRGMAVVSGQPDDGSLGLTGIEERLLTYAEELCDLAGDDALPSELAAAARIVEAARESVATREPVSLRGG